MSDLSTVLRRIHALLATAERKAGNEQEAALAAERAAELMARYQITAATVEAAAPATAAPRAEEPIVSRRAEDNGPEARKRVAWKMAIVTGVAASLDCRTYWHGHEPTLYGRTSAVDAARYLVAYLYREVDRLAAEQAHGYGRSYAHAYRIGCAGRISQRLVEAKRERDAAARDAAARGGALPAAPGDDTAGALVVTGAALAVIDRDRAALATAWSQYSAHMKKSAPIGAVRDAAGYYAGRAAGDKVRLASGRPLGAGK
jgi:hypothetical protein